MSLAEIGEPAKIQNPDLQVAADGSVRVKEMIFQALRKELASDGGGADNRKPTIFQILGF